MIKKLIHLFKSRTLIRAAATTALVAYPIGCFALLLLPDNWEAVGGALFMISVIGLIFALPSYLSRIAFVPQVFRFVDGTASLDELEIDFRRRSQAFAFQVFSLITLGGIMYLVIASDIVNAGEGNLWMPRVDDHWLAILFGALIYILMLPLAYLAWKLPQPVEDDDPQFEGPTSEHEVRDNIVVSFMTIGLAAGVLFSGDAILWMACGTTLGFVLDFVWRRRKQKEK